MRAGAGAGPGLQSLPSCRGGRKNSRGFWNSSFTNLKDEFQALLRWLYKHTMLTVLISGERHSTITFWLLLFIIRVQYLDIDLAGRNKKQNFKKYYVRKLNFNHLYVFLQTPRLNKTIKGNKVGISIHIYFSRWGKVL